MTVNLGNSIYIKEGYKCNKKVYEHTCLRCNVDFESFKSKQKYCSKSCSATSTSNRAINDPSLFSKGLCDEITSYTLGLFYSDGSITLDRINICSNDVDILEKIRLEMTPEKKMYGKGKCKNIVSNNKNDLNFIKGLGVTTRKSYDARLPIFDEKYMSHFIRGLFDGDGSVYKSTTRDNSRGTSYTYTYISFTTGSYMFAEDIQRFLYTVNIKSKINKDCRRDNWYVKITSIGDVNRFKNYIYKDATIYMNRKYSKFTEMR